MNIFYLDKNPRQAAQWQCDKHVVKMPVETAQLLCTAHRVLDGTEYIDRTKNNRKIKRWKMPDKFHESLFYKATHVNHPSAVWVRESKDHYDWLYEHFIALSNEFTQRYNKPHRSWELLAPFLLQAPVNITKSGFVDPIPAINDKYQDMIVLNNSIQSYRNYYQFAKTDLHQWKQNKPDWIFEVKVNRV